MSSFRIRRDGREYLVDDEKGLIRLARCGALLGEDKLREEPEGLWTDANLHPLLWEIFQADPWAAWDDLDEAEDPEELWNTLTRSASMAGRDERAERAEPSPRVKPPEDEDAETLAPIKPRGLPVASKSSPTKKPFRPPRRRRSSSVSTGSRWTGPTKAGDVKPVSGGDLKPGVRVERPAGIKIGTLAPPESAHESDAESGAIKIKVPDAHETRVVPPVDMLVETPGVKQSSPPEGPPSLTLPSLGPRGQVIAFPAPTVGGGNRGGALPAEKPIEDPTLPPRIMQPERTRLERTRPGPVSPSIPADAPVRSFRAAPPSSRSTTTFSLGRVIPVVLLFGGIVAAIAWWVQLQSQQTFNNIPVVEAPRPPGEDEAGAADGTTVSIPDERKVHSRVDDEPEFIKSLRDRLPVGDQRDIKTAEDLEEVMFLDLSRLQIHGVKVEAEVVEWTEDEENPLPAKMTLVVQADSFGEPERELAAIGLVVGKYVTHQDLNILVFEVQLVGEDGKAWRKRPTADSAAALYSRDISLEEYLLD